MYENFLLNRTKISCWIDSKNLAESNLNPAESNHSKPGNPLQQKIMSTNLGSTCDRVIQIFTVKNWSFFHHLLCVLILDNAGGHSFICSDDWHGMDDRHGSLVYKTKSYDLFDDVTSFARICVDLRANSFERFSVPLRCYFWNECSHFWNVGSFGVAIFGTALPKMDAFQKWKAWPQFGQLGCQVLTCLQALQSGPDCGQIFHFWVLLV